MTSKEYLRQVEQATIKIKLYQSEVNRIRDEITSLSSVDYSAPVVQSSNRTDLADRVARLEEAEEQNRQACLLLSKLIEEVVATIKQVKNATLCMLLYYRYIKLLTWEEVADKIHHTTRAIHRTLHRQALTEVDKIRAK